VLEPSGLTEFCRELFNLLYTVLSQRRTTNQAYKLLSVPEVVMRHVVDSSEHALLRSMDCQVSRKVGRRKQRDMVRSWTLRNVLLKSSQNRKIRVAVKTSQIPPLSTSNPKKNIAGLEWEARYYKINILRKQEKLSDNHSLLMTKLAFSTSVWSTWHVSIFLKIGS